MALIGYTISTLSHPPSHQCETWTAKINAEIMSKPCHLCALQLNYWEYVVLICLEISIYSCEFNWQIINLAAQWLSHEMSHPVHACSLAIPRYWVMLPIGSMTAASQATCSCSSCITVMLPPCYMVITDHHHLGWGVDHVNQKQKLTDKERKWASKWLCQICCQTSAPHDFLFAHDAHAASVFNFFLLLCY